MNVLNHPFPPVYDENSHILILGSFPSVKSREQGFFYGHPQNRFWRVLAAVYHDEVPLTVPDRRAFLLRHGVALWDVLAACEIRGSADATIRAAAPNDLGPILAGAPIRAVFANGQTAGKLYRQYDEASLGRPAVILPSTSPANAAWSLERLVEAWKIIRF